MAIYDKKERLYLSNYQYNRARVFDVLCDIIDDNNGRIISRSSAVITNRNLSAAIHDIQNKLDRLPESRFIHDDAKKRDNYVVYRNNLIEQLARYKAIDNNPLTVRALSYVAFVLNDTYYYLQLDDNIFMDNFYEKSPVVNNKHKRVYLEKVNSDIFLYDCLLGFKAPRADVVEIAHLLFNFLMNAPAGHASDRPAKFINID